MNYIKSLNINRIKDGKMESVEDSVMTEYPLTIFLNGNELVTLLCLPKGLKYLAVGFLMSEGIIENKTQIKNVSVDEEKGHAYIDLDNKSLSTDKLFSKRIVTTGCGKGTVFYNAIDSLKIIDSNMKIGWKKILNLSSKLNEHSTLFRETGGVHSCALCNCDDILLFYEDVGRHNSIDKIIGESVLSDLDLSDKILISSGRISSEMIIKAIKSNIPIIVSRSASTGLSVKIAKQFNATLIGFARGNRMNIYNGQDRLLIEDDLE